ncbi:MULTISPECIES: ADP-ribosylglycohydrolase family protein [unclassified Nocardioides]|uniref:ADP-ribosylglycohydrolase family protein n=1 Tax=unclassified Nocardioides TaxID=2615069 RepID=UPI0030142533
MRRLLQLTPTQADRAAGALIGSAVGDALGVHYEFATPPGAGQDAAMLGGGLGDFAPGEWSDDTSMAIVIAEAVRATGSVATPAALDLIAQGFVRWYRSSPPDIGIQTSRVLGAASCRLEAGEDGPGRVLAQEATIDALDHPRSAGNGALMRTAPVALAHLDDRVALAGAARRVASLTHADPLAGDSCVLWSEAVRVAVVDGRIDLTAGLDLLTSRSEQWAGWLADALRPERRSEDVPGREFTPNGFTVTALQAAAAAIAHTPETPGQLERGLHGAIRIGDDTDTVAAIAGGLLGARWGANAVPEEWCRAIHGWPGYRYADLLALAPGH